MASVGVAGALALTFAMPMVLFAISPALLGVPHVASDVRYLLIRPRHVRGFVPFIIAGCLALLALRVITALHLSAISLYPIEILIGGLMVVGAATFAASSSRFRPRALLVIAAALALTNFATRAPRTSLLVFAHLHNFVGIALWLLVFRKRASAAIPLALVLASLGTIFLVGNTLASASAFNLAITDVASYLAPGLAPSLGICLVLSYIFLQAIHYSVWLGWIPSETRDASRTLVQDFRWLGLALIATAMLAVAAASLHDLHATRDLYLSLAVFHAYIELALLAFWLA